jgi:hypothetical protein
MISPKGEFSLFVDNVYVSLYVSQIFQTPVTMGIAPSQGGELQLQWDHGTLLQATNVTGRWTAISGAVSPFTVTPGASGRTFYQVRTP